METKIILIISLLFSINTLNAQSMKNYKPNTKARGLNINMEALERSISAMQANYDKAKVEFNQCYHNLANEMSSPNPNHLLLKYNLNRCIDLNETYAPPRYKTALYNPVGDLYAIAGKYYLSQDEIDDARKAYHSAVAWYVENDYPNKALKCCDEFLEQDFDETLNRYKEKVKN